MLSICTSLKFCRLIKSVKSLIAENKQPKIKEKNKLAITKRIFLQTRKYMNERTQCVFEWEDNFVEKGGIADYLYFLLFPPVLLRPSPWSLKQIL